MSEADSRSWYTSKELPSVTVCLSPRLRLNECLCVFMWHVHGPVDRTLEETGVSRHGEKQTGEGMWTSGSPVG